MLAPFSRRSHSCWLRAKDAGFDSGMGDMEPPVSQPGSIGGMNGGGLSAA